MCGQLFFKSLFLWSFHLDSCQCCFCSSDKMIQHWQVPVLYARYYVRATFLLHFWGLILPKATVWSPNTAQCEQKPKFSSVKTCSFVRSSHIVLVYCQNIRVSLNYSQIRARDSCAYPSVSTQSHRLRYKSLGLGVCSEVYATTVHDRTLLTGFLCGKVCSPAMAPSTSLPT